MQHEQLAHKVERAVAETLERLWSALRFAPLGYFTPRADGRIVECNLPGAECLQSTAPTCPGRSIDTSFSRSSPALRAVLDRLWQGRPQ